MINVSGINVWDGTKRQSKGLEMQYVIKSTLLSEFFGEWHS